MMTINLASKAPDNASRKADGEPRERESILNLVDDDEYSSDHADGNADNAADLDCQDQTTVGRDQSLVDIDTVQQKQGGDVLHYYSSAPDDEDFDNAARGDNSYSSAPGDDDLDCQDQMTVGRDESLVNIDIVQENKNQFSPLVNIDRVQVDADNEADDDHNVLHYYDDDDNDNSDTVDADAEADDDNNVL